MIEQGTEEWFAARRGKATASKIADIMAKGRGGGESKTRTNYRAQLIAERLSGRTAESYTNGPMQWGIDNEPVAKARYEIMFDCEIKNVGLVDHPKIPMSAASPDGLIGDDGLIEVKCPNTATHLATLRGAKIDSGYVKQMQWQMACTGRKWCDFVSFDPRLPDELALHRQRVDRDLGFIIDIEEAVKSFLAEVEAEVAELRAMTEAA